MKDPTLLLGRGFEALYIYLIGVLCFIHLSTQVSVQFGQQGLNCRTDAKETFDGGEILIWTEEDLASCRNSEYNTTLPDAKAIISTSRSTSTKCNKQHAVLIRQERVRSKRHSPLKCPRGMSDQGDEKCVVQVFH